MIHFVFGLVQVVGLLVWNALLAFGLVAWASLRVVSAFLFARWG